MTEQTKGSKPAHKDTAVLKERSSSGAESNSSGYGGQYEGSSQRGETSDWYGETKGKNQTPDASEKSEPSSQKTSR